MFPPYLQVGWMRVGKEVALGWMGGGYGRWGGHTLMDNMALTQLPLWQEAFFGKALMDLSRKALLAAGGVGDGAARPSLGQGAPRPRGDPSLAGALQGAPPDRRETPTHPRGEQSRELDWEPKPRPPSLGRRVLKGTWGLPWTPGAVGHWGLLEDAEGSWGCCRQRGV